MTETAPTTPLVPPPLRRYHLLAKPTGAACNLDCQYCFFLSKDALYPNERLRMKHETLEEYIRQLLDSHSAPEVTVAWQGGEPTLMGLDFFRTSVELVEKYRRRDQVVNHTIQTNGTLLDDEWGAFLKKHSFLVGLSVDGPKEIHDTYRWDKAGKGTFDSVMAGWETLRRFKVDFNILCTMNAANADHGRTVYRFFRDELKAEWVQFIPIIERATADTIQIANLGWSERPGSRRILYTQSGDMVTERSIKPEQYGRFMVDVFEEWVRHDIAQVYVQLFDVTLHSWFGEYPLCIHAPTCGLGPALEHNGDVYTCDHFVEPDYRLGNLHETSLGDLVASPKMVKFGADKRDALTQQCQACDVRFACNGGCPKDRFALSKDGEPGHNYLCEGYQHFYNHVRPVMDRMAWLLRQNRAPSEMMAFYAEEDRKRGGYEPCTCGSGKKFRFCHGGG